MSRGVATNCESCGKDITMAGSPVCSICDPNIEAILTSGGSGKPPNLCVTCFRAHVEDHKKKAEGDERLHDNV